MRPAELLVIKVTWAQRGSVQFSGAERSGAAWFPAGCAVGEGVAAIKVEACGAAQCAQKGHGTRRARALGNTAKEIQGQLLPGSNMAAEGVCVFAEAAGLHLAGFTSLAESPQGRPGCRYWGVLSFGAFPACLLQQQQQQLARVFILK